MSKPYKVTNNYVFIVYECAKKVQNAEFGLSVSDGYIHGVYINQDEATGKAHSLIATGRGYIAVLKKPLQGKSKCIFDLGVAW